MGLAGVFIGVFAVMFGGSMFLSVPVFRLVFPNESFGTIVGSIKIGSFVRGVFSTASTRKQINFAAAPKYVLLLVGSVLGAFSVSALSSNYMIPVLILAIVVTLNAQKLSDIIKENVGAKHLLAFIVGIYGGFFGAGLGLLLVALVRVYEADLYGEDSELMTLKIQARFLEFLVAIVAITGHIMGGAIRFSTWPMWLYWAVGGAIGGYIGGKLLIKFQKASPKIQKRLLYFSFGVALVTAFYVQFDGTLWNVKTSLEAGPIPSE
ncbi:MAG: hypothetical protein Hens3KO_21660 [Henriciella sp.]